MNYFVSIDILIILWNDFQTLQSLSNIAANAQTNPSPSNANGIFYNKLSENVYSEYFKDMLLFIQRPMKKFGAAN